MFCTEMNNGSNLLKCCACTAIREFKKYVVMFLEPLPGILLVNAIETLAPVTSLLLQSEK